MLDDNRIQLRLHAHRELDAYRITSDQLQRMESAGNELGLDFQLALGLLFSGSSFLAGLLLNPPPEGTIKTVLVAITVVELLGGIIFGIRYFVFRSAHSNVFREVREMPLGPLGDETHPVGVTELGHLVLEAAPPPPAPPAQPEAPPAVEEVIEAEEAQPEKGK